MSSQKANSMRQNSKSAATPPRKRMDKCQAGFTLVEMLVVVTIIGLIMALVGPRVLNYLGKSKVKTAKISDRQLFERPRSILS